MICLLNVSSVKQTQILNQRKLKVTDIKTRVVSIPYFTNLGDGKSTIKIFKLSYCCTL